MKHLGGTYDERTMASARSEPKASHSKAYFDPEARYAATGVTRVV